MIEILVLLACVALVLVPIYFIFHGVYKDGAFGRVALGGIAFNASGVVVEGFFKVYVLGGEIDWDVMTAFAAMLIVFFAIFICWHLFRFHSRVVGARGTKPCGILDQPGCPYITGAPVPAPMHGGRRAGDRAAGRFSLTRQA